MRKRLGGERADRRRPGALRGPLADPDPGRVRGRRQLRGPRRRSPCPTAAPCRGSSSTTTVDGGRPGHHHARDRPPLHDRLGPVHGSNLSLLVKRRRRQPAFAAPNAPRPGTEHAGQPRRLVPRAGQPGRAPFPLHDGILSRDGYYLLDDTTARCSGRRQPASQPAPGRTRRLPGRLPVRLRQQLRRRARRLPQPHRPAPLLPARGLRDLVLPLPGLQREGLQAAADALPGKKSRSTCSSSTPTGSRRTTGTAGSGRRSTSPTRERFVDWAHGKGLDVILNIHPSISTDDPNYLAASAAAGGLPTPPAAASASSASPNVTCGGWDWGQPERRRVLLRPARAVRGGSASTRGGSTGAATTAG